MGVWKWGREYGRCQKKPCANHSIRKSEQVGGRFPLPPRFHSQSTQMLPQSSESILVRSSFSSSAIATSISSTSKGSSESPRLSLPPFVSPVRSSILNSFNSSSFLRSSDRTSRDYVSFFVWKSYYRLILNDLLCFTDIYEHWREGLWDRFVQLNTSKCLCHLNHRAHTR